MGRLNLVLVWILSHKIFKVIQNEANFASVYNNIIRDMFIEHENSIQSSASR